MSTNKQQEFPRIKFDAKVFTIDSWTILRVPENASKKLPSRGMVYVKGTINGFTFESPLEPDGKGSHWLTVTSQMLTNARASIGDSVKLEIEYMKDWPEPEIPNDLLKALKASPKEYALWKEVTPNARWDWIRWISSTKNPDTRQKRINVELDKLKKGMRRPCCFNRSMCCNPNVAKNGVLLTV